MRWLRIAFLFYRLKNDSGSKFLLKLFYDNGRSAEKHRENAAIS